LKQAPCCVFDRFFEDVLLLLVEQLDGLAPRGGVGVGREPVCEIEIVDDDATAIFGQRTRQEGELRTNIVFTIKRFGADLKRIQRLRL
jgi:hypothetical protein